MIQNEENRKVLHSLGLLDESTSNPPRYDHEAFFLYSYFLRNHLILSKSMRTSIDDRLAIRVCISVVGSLLLIFRTKHHF